MIPTRFVPPAPLAVRPTGFVRPSGAAALPSQVAKVQAILAWLNHLPRNRSVLTGIQDAATKSAVRAFEVAYNAENRCRRHEPGAPCQAGRTYNPPVLPASITVDDGTIGPQVIAAALNYDVAAAIDGYGMGITDAEIRAATVAAPTADAAALAVKQSTTPAPQSSTPAVRTSPTPAPQQQPASTFPTGPVIAGVVGLAVIAAAVAYKRSQRKGR